MPTMLHRAVVVGLVMYVACSASSAGRAKSDVPSEFLEGLLEGMDPRIRPPSKDNSPVVVNVNLHVISFSSINEISMDFKTDIYFRESWKDPRLIYVEGSPTISLSSRFVDQIWTPDLYFPNEKEARFHDVTMPNRLLKISPDGTVIFSTRLTLVLSCPMELESFPMDTQTCAIKIESYAYETHELQLLWQEPAVEIDEELELPQFELVKFTNTTCQKQYKTTGSFPCLKATFTLYRNFGFFLLQTYIPSTLIIILSWVSFWVSIEAVPARIALGVTTVLTMTTHLSGSKDNVPKVSYPKAIDIWMSMGMLFVFSALLEYALVNAISRQHAKRELYKKTEKLEDATEMTACTDSGADSSPKVYYSRRSAINYRQLARHIDKTSRYAFPSVFLIFNIIYWPIYAAKRVQ